MSSSSPLKRTATNGTGQAGTGVHGDPGAGGNWRIQQLTGFGGIVGLLSANPCPFMKFLVFLTVGISGGLAACSLAPRYQRPDTATAPAEYREALGWKLATPSDVAPRGPWWT